MVQVIRHKRSEGAVMMQKEIGITAKDGSEEIMEVLTFPALEKDGIAAHFFTTRTGGVSEGIYSSLNLSFNRGDEKERVSENFRRVAQALGCSASDIVCSDQTHTTNLLRVGAGDGGKGIVREKDYHDIDGLMTNEPGVALATFYADCVPLYFVDIRNRAIGLAHSGWRGTAGKIGDKMVRRMGEEFGSRPEDILAAIGPSICQDCYEVSEEVAGVFAELFTEKGELLSMVRSAGIFPADQTHVLLPGREPGKFQLNLWLSNLLILLEAGIPLPNLAVTDICTCHNPQYLFSHRASEGKRGNLGAFLMLKRQEETMLKKN